MVLLGLLLCVAVSGTIPRWEAYCNYECAWKDCPTPAEYDFVPCKRTVLSESCVDGTKECPDKWSFGAWPTLNQDGSAPQSNGGVPQRANLTLHLDKISSGLDVWVPQEDFDGNIVLDWEAWTPNWDFCDSSDPNWMSEHYPLYSIGLVQKEHPTWNLTQVIAQARKEFETAALEFMVETLKVIRQRRPLAKVGYYGYPRIVNWPCTIDNGTILCGYDDPSVGPAARAANDFLEPLWNWSTGLFPSVYLSPEKPIIEPYPLWQWYLRDTVGMTMNESIRIVNVYKSGNPAEAPILPYHWSLYHNGTTALLPVDLEMILQETFRPPYCTGLIIWGSNADTPLPKFLKEVEGPAFLKAHTFATHCAETKCSGHGWCNSLFTANVTGCVCDRGYSHSDCSHHGV